MRYGSWQGVFQGKTGHRIETETTLARDRAPEPFSAKPDGIGQGAMAMDFVGKTLLDTTRAIEQSVFQLDLSSEDGFLQGLDPRAKVICFLLLLLLTAFSKGLWMMFSTYLLTVALAMASRIPLGFFIKRVWLFIPLFTGLIALPALFNIVTPGDSIWTLVVFNSPISFGPFEFPAYLAITQQGLTTAAMLILRVAVSVSLAILLVLTTRWMDLLRALSILKVPQVVILVTAMTYRYIHLFLRNLENMLLARKSRQFAPSAMKDQHGWISSRLGALVAKSYHLSTEVHLAMVSRGWSGTPKGLEQFHFKAKDAVSVAVAFILFSSEILFDKIY